MQVRSFMWLLRWWLLVAFHSVRFRASRRVVHVIPDRFDLYSLLVLSLPAGLFTTVLPSEVVARIFDSLLLEGNKVLLRIGLALLKTFERSICAASHPAQLRKVLDARLARMYDADALMAAAFKGVGAMPTAHIKPLRSLAVAAVDAQLADQRQRLELIICRTH
jgi:hypothetical protein